MNPAYTEISNEEADRIIKSANLKLLAETVKNPISGLELYELAESLLSN